VIPRRTALEVALLKAVAARYVMWTEARARVQAAERDLIAELVEALISGAPASLEPTFREDWLEADGDAARVRVVIDQVASLSDTSAAARHRALLAR
jgi:dGTPase